MQQYLVGSERDLRSCELKQLQERPENNLRFQWGASQLWRSLPLLFSIRSSYIYIYDYHVHIISIFDWYPMSFRHDSRRGTVIVTVRRPASACGSSIRIAHNKISSLVSPSRTAYPCSFFGPFACFLPQPETTVGINFNYNRTCFQKDPILFNL